QVPRSRRSRASCARSRRAFARSVDSGFRMSVSTPTILRADGLSKRFGSVAVLNDITLDVRAGEIHAIIGENGAGKSTLMRLLSGYLSPTGGSIWIDGKQVQFGGPAEAQSSGIALVHQEILLADGLTVADNMF